MDRAASAERLYALVADRSRLIIMAMNFGLIRPRMLFEHFFQLVAQTQVKRSGERRRAIYCAGERSLHRSAAQELFDTQLYPVLDQQDGWLQ
jgi:hypothetical protein